MKLRDDIYTTAVQAFIEAARANKTKISIAVEVQEDSEISNLPQEAYINGFLFCTFDFGAEDTWVADQIQIENNTFSCVLVYNNSGTSGTSGNWQEYPVSFPCVNIIGIDSPNLDTNILPLSSYDEDFRNKVENSKKHLKLVSKLEEK
jgi:hypothetical protein